MLTINATALRAPVNEAVAANHDGAGNAADPAGFASLLRQTQAAPQPAATLPAAPPMAAADAAPAHAEAGPEAHDNAPSEAQDSSSAPQESPSAPPESDPGSRARALLRNRLRAADGTGAARPDAQPGAPTTGGAKADAAGTAPADKRANAAAPRAAGTDPGLDPGVMHWLAGLQRATAAAGDSGAAKTDADAAQPAFGDESSSARTRGHSAGASAADLKAAADLKDAAAQARAQGADTSTAGLFAQVQAEQAPTGKAPAPASSRIDGLKDMTAQNAAALASAPGAAPEVAAPAPVVVSAPVDAPDFAHELGLRLSVLARDGVQHAELHLNPADMGPVSVQIVMDGTQAHVAFGADVAATRQAIEAGLPELAGALRDAGFTLAGGGVSQHAGGRGDGSGAHPGSDASPRRSVDAQTVRRVGTAARRIVTAGGVDLFA